MWRVGAVRVRVGPERVTLFVAQAPGGDHDIGLELYAANERKGLLEAVLDRRVELLPS